MLIRDTEIWRQGRADVRVQDGKIHEIGLIAPRQGERIIDARGAALLPGLHDHHIHLAAFAVAQTSVPCGPPDINGVEELATMLARPGQGWLRGIGYHESVAGMLDRQLLDRWASHRPVRIQHRSGRMWFLNSPALDLLLAQGDAPPGLDRGSGRLFDEDQWLRNALQGIPPSFEAVSRCLAAFGVTGITDMSPANDMKMTAHFAREQARDALRQRAILAGTLGLINGVFDDRLRLGPLKLHLHENALPDLAASIDLVRAGHREGRAVAIHCTTETELVFALSLFDSASTVEGDRIEHAGVTPDHLLEEVARLGLRVVSQPHFIAQRGDQYLRDVDPCDQPFLYRLAAFRRAGVPLAAGSDAPYGSADPWLAMRAAISRQTRTGQEITPEEALDPESALALFLADPSDLTSERTIMAGAAADLCLLDRPWAQARDRLHASDINLTLVGGSIIHERSDPPPE